MTRLCFRVYVVFGFLSLLTYVLCTLTASPPVAVAVQDGPAEAEAEVDSDPTEEHGHDAEDEVDGDDDPMEEHDGDRDGAQHKLPSPPCMEGYM